MKESTRRLIPRQRRREFRGPDAHIECTIVDEAGKDVSRCLMVVACVDKGTNRAMDWPADTMALFFEK